MVTTNKGKLPVAKIKDGISTEWKDMKSRKVAYKLQVVSWLTVGGMKNQKQGKNSGEFGKKFQVIVTKTRNMDEGSSV